MGVGKYSPTISASYAFDQKWWERNGGGYGNGENPESALDDDGYDSYGYSGDGCGPDRAGHLEEDYMLGEWIPALDEDEEDIYHYPLYEDIFSNWSSRLLGDLPKFTRVQYERLYAEYIKFGGIRYIFRGSYLYVHEDDLATFTERNAKCLEEYQKGMK